MKTYASNPGNIRVKLLRVLYHMPRVSLVLILGAVGLFTLAFVNREMISASFGIVCLGILWRVIDNANYRFTAGDVNISKVLSLDPPLFATSTNMQNNYGLRFYPAIKIVRGKVPAARGQRVEVGDYFAAACLYAGSFERPYWDNFYPVPISVATDDLAVIEHHDQALVPLRDELNARLALVDTPEKPGIYFIDQDRLEALKSRTKAAGDA